MGKCKQQQFLCLDLLQALICSCDIIRNLVHLCSDERCVSALFESIASAIVAVMTAPRSCVAVQAAAVRALNSLSSRRRLDQ